jgi:hypothetical protein
MTHSFQVINNNLDLQHQMATSHNKLLEIKRSVAAEWLGRRTLNQRVVGSNPGEGLAEALIELESENDTIFGCKISQCLIFSYIFGVLSVPLLFWTYSVPH